MPSLNPRSLVLASSSVYREMLLSRLGLPFTCAAPEIDETVLNNEISEQTALRLAFNKAHALKAQFPTALIIGADQVALLANTQLGKPGTYKNAVQQLQKMRGQQVIFHTALCLYNSATDSAQTELVINTVTMRHYTDQEIERYLQIEKPYDCAGSAKIEGLGITLVAEITGPDPNALIGLPLIALTTMLKNEGVVLP